MPDEIPEIWFYCPAEGQPSASPHFTRFSLVNLPVRAQRARTAAMY